MHSTERPILCNLAKCPLLLDGHLPILTMTMKAPISCEHDGRRPSVHAHVHLAAWLFWNEIGQIEMDPDERIGGVIRLLFDKFKELGSARVATGGIPHGADDSETSRLRRRLCVRPNDARTHVVDGRARRTTSHSKPMTAWNVLLRDHHPGYISWEQFEENQRLISENAHMQLRTERKSARGGRALLTGLVRCGRCGRTMWVFYGSQSSHAHRYFCPRR
jgi:hypothetical protein